MAHKTSPSETTETAQSLCRNQLIYALLALSLGIFGAHNFYAGYTKKGAAQMILTALTPLTFGLSLVIVIVWSIINVFCTNTDANGIPFTPARTTKIVAGILMIIFNLGGALLGITALLMYIFAWIIFAETEKSIGPLLDYTTQVSVMSYDTPSVDPRLCDDILPRTNPNIPNEIACAVHTTDHQVVIMLQGVNEPLRIRLKKERPAIQEYKETLLIPTIFQH